MDLALFQSEDPQLKSEFVEKLRWACSNIGFFIIKGHGVTENCVNDAWNITKTYFDLPLYEKRKILLGLNGYLYGYSGLEKEALTRSLGKKSLPDLKESFCVGPYNIQWNCQKTIWPNKPHGFKQIWMQYYMAMEGLSNTLLRAFALALNLEELWFKDKTNYHASALRALNYPALPPPHKKNQLRAGEHTDYGTFTILKSDGPGLQVLNKKGKWIHVKNLPNTFVVNLGDLMKFWTSNFWVSTKHRVIATNSDYEQRRQSLAFFHNVNLDTIIKPLEVKADFSAPIQKHPILFGEFLHQKHKAATELSIRKVK
ncbi:MAG: 2-oxoglutarate and iron-dependent oxygenase domain-containing protein [Nitrospirales bacterium]|nr:hypothetical protein [Nitrospirales bacterium]